MPHIKPSSYAASQVTTSDNKYVGGRSEGERDTWFARLGRRARVMSNGCWLVGDDPTQYMHIQVYGQWVNAHRAVYSLFNDDRELDTDDHVHHTCFTPACINPDHLELLSAREHSALHAHLRSM